MSEIENKTLCIALPSLIHRIGGKQVKQVKLIALDEGCELKRIRRSRNWQLVGHVNNIESVINLLKQRYIVEMRYLIDKLDEKLLSIQPPPETTKQTLARLLITQPNITLSELMLQTNCSLAEARSARFEADVF